LRIRSRKPCFFLRFRLLGWKVRFTHGLLEEGKSPPKARAKKVSDAWGGAERRELRVHDHPLATRSRCRDQNPGAGRARGRLDDVGSGLVLHHRARDLGDYSLTRRAHQSSAWG
jgi:hypothetical protein